MTDFLLLAFIFLIAGVIAVPIATRMGLGSVLGYLLAGIAISPVLALLDVDVVSIQHFAEFGVVMMLFLVGLELEPKMLWAMRGKLLGLGGGQVGLTTMAIMGAAMAFGQPWMVGLAIGFVMAVSSTAIVLQTLGEKGLMKSDGGEASFSVLLAQDVAVIPMLAIIPLLALPALGAHGAHGDGHGQAMSLVAGLAGWQTALVTLVAIAFVVVLGNYLESPIFRFIAGSGLRELFTATALMIVIGIALLMSLVGLSPALGTFLAGVVLANSEYRHELESDVEPFKGLLLGVFFMSVGAGIDFAFLLDNFATTIALTLGMMAIKIIIILLLARLFKVRGAGKWLFALGLAQAGEFGFVILSFTLANGAIPEAIADQLLLMVALSMLLTPALFILYDKVIAPRYAENQERGADAIVENNHIVIAGHGRVGGIVRRMLDGAGYTATVIDFSAKQLEMIAKFGFKAYFGDATRPDLLASAGLANAKIFVIAIDGKEQITELVKYVRRAYPDVHIVARAVDRMHVYDLWAAGCRDIVRETYDSSLRMGRSTFEALGIPREKAERLKEAFSATDRMTMLEMAEHYDPTIVATENTAYMEKFRTHAHTWEQELREKMKGIIAESK